jgi:hypothetical protein
MTDLPTTFLAKTRKTNCTVWIGSTNTLGYGIISIDGRLQLAHRIAFEAEYGPIPQGLVIDHLCRVRNCVNPLHLEAVTSGENTRRGRASITLKVGDTCINGHLIADGDIYVRPGRTTTECRSCRNAVSSKKGNRRPTVRRSAERVDTDLTATERLEDGAA